MERNGLFNIGQTTYALDPWQSSAFAIAETDTLYIAKPLDCKSTLIGVLFITAANFVEVPTEQRFRYLPPTYGFNGYYCIAAYKPKANVASSEEDGIKNGVMRCKFKSEETGEETSRDIRYTIYDRSHL